MEQERVDDQCGGPLANDESLYMLRTIRGRVPVIFYWIQDYRFLNFFNLLNMIVTLFSAAVIIVALMVLSGSLPMTREVREAIFITWACGGGLVAIYVIVGAGFHGMITYELSHRFHMDTLGSMVLRGLGYLIWIAMMWTVKGEYERPSVHFDDDDWVFTDPTEAFTKREGKDAEAVVLVFGIILNVMSVFTGIREIICHANPEGCIPAEAFILNEARNAKKYVYPSFGKSASSSELESVRRKLPSMSYIDSSISFWGEYNVLNILTAVFSVVQSLVSLLILLHVIRMSESLRHGLAIGYMSGGLLLMIGLALSSTWFYSAYEDITQRYSDETIWGTAGIFILFAVFFGMTFFVSLQYGLSEIVEDDLTIDDLHFDDDFFVDGVVKRQILKEDGKEIEAGVLIFGVFIGIFSAYLAVRQMLSHWRAEVTTNSNEHRLKKYTSTFINMGKIRKRVQLDSGPGYTPIIPTD